MRLTLNAGPWAGFALAAMLAMTTPQLVLAGGWTLDAGQLSASLDIVHTQFDRVKKFDGHTGKTGDVTFVSTGISFEFGLYDWVTVFASVPYEVSSRDGTAAGPSLDRRKGETNLGDGRLGLRVRIFDEFDDDLATVALSGAIKTPLSNYDEHKLHSLGDGQTDLELKLGVGRMFTLFGLEHFVSVDAGYRWRIGDPGDEIFAFGEVGTYVTPDLAVRLFVDGVDSRSGLGLESPAFGAEAAATGLPPFPKVEEDAVRVGGGLSYALTENTDLGLFYAQNVDADNTSVDTVFGLSISIRR